MDNDKKTIKPTSIGGIAGGDKYIVQNILFKFAVDSKGIYGGDDYAMKVAGHEVYIVFYKKIVEIELNYLFLFS